MTTDAEDKAIAVGDIVQMNDKTPNKAFHYQVGVVSEIKSFGAIVDFGMPGYGIAPLRAANSEYVIVGRLRWPWEV